MLLNWIAGSRASTAPERAPAKGEVGLIAGTRVATETGWRPVEEICAGDMLMTFDGGLQRVTSVTRQLHPMPPVGLDQIRPLMEIAEGVIGNDQPLRILADQTIIIESDLAEVLFGDPFAPIPARTLERVPGVKMVMPESPVVVVTFGFDQDQVIFAEGMALILCQSSAMVQPTSLEEALWADDVTRYHVLEENDALMVAAGMIGQTARAMAQDTQVASATIRMN